jgi:hypothetical protein
LDNEFLSVTLRAFEILPGPILPVFKTTKYVSDRPFSCEKLAAQCLPLLKTDQNQSQQFLKVLANSNSFGAKRRRTSHINLKLKAQLTKFEYLTDAL